MTIETQCPLETRILQVFRHLGIAQAHVVANITPDWLGIATGHPALVTSLTLVCPMSLDPHDVSPFASRLLVFTGDQGPQPERLRRSLTSLPDAALITLADYASESWADVVADRTDEVAQPLLEFLERMDRRYGTKAVALPESEGEVAGISYRIRGTGPPLLLFPLALAPSQWDPLLPALASHYCTITLAGGALGIVTYLEARGRMGYLEAVRRLMDAVQVRPGEAVAEIGCGSGVLIRWLARQTAGANQILGVDMNRYLLREAAALIEKDGLSKSITLQEGNAEALPLPDGSVDIVLACTVLEEGDADKMLTEMVRVTRPRGRVAVIVRAIDMPWWLNLPLRPALKTKLEAPGWVGSGVAAQGCGDASIYQRLRRAGLTPLSLFPHLVPVTKADPRFTMLQQQYVAMLHGEEAIEWRNAVAEAEADGTFFIAQPFHCAVGMKP